MAVAARSNGTYHVASPNGAIYTVTVSDGAFFCDCAAGKYGNACSHALAAKHHQSAKQKADTP